MSAFTPIGEGARARLRRAARLTAAGLAAALLLAGCKTEVYQNLTETQVNAMMSVLLKNGIEPEKTATKNGYALSVESDRVAQTLELMRDSNLPRADYETMGGIFAAKGMISSATEEKARMTYALSQELSETFSTIDGVLTSRVHVVLETQDLATGKTTPASAAVFLRHTPDSQTPNLVPRIQQLTANAVPGLEKERVSVMLVPVRETITTPIIDAREARDDVERFFFIGGIVLFILSIPGLAGGVLWWRRRGGQARDKDEGRKGASEGGAG